MKEEGYLVCLSFYKLIKKNCKAVSLVDALRETILTHQRNPQWP